MKAPVKRFTGTAENYVKYRAGFPDSLIDFLAMECGLVPESIIADLGSGTGILSKMFLDNGNAVFAVEPNADMRQGAERLLGHMHGFYSVDATAESTTLKDSSVDFVTAGRALQWFDAPVALNEMARILKPGGQAVFVWNKPRAPVSPQLSAYRKVLRTFCRELETKNQRRDAAIDLLKQNGFRVKLLDYTQRLDLDQLQGLVLSLSISPNADDPAFEPMLAALAQLFAEHQENGQLTFDYSTTVYYGRPSS